MNMTLCKGAEKGKLRKTAPLLKGVMDVRLSPSCLREVRKDNCSETDTLV